MLGPYSFILGYEVSFFLAVTICFLKLHFGFSFSNSIWIGTVNFEGYFGFVCLGYQLVPPSIWRHWGEEFYLVVMFFDLSLVQSLVV